MKRFLQIALFGCLVLANSSLSAQPGEVKRSEDVVYARKFGTALTAKLIPREGKVHGWPELGQDVVLFADWFDLYLRGMKK